MDVEVLRNLRKAILEYDSEAAAAWAAKALENGIDPLEGIGAVTEAIGQVGDAFGRGELWLPELMSAAKAMQVAMPILQERVRRTGKELKGLGTIVIGTVYGDVHSIGKTLVATLAAAAGFEVIDLGVNVSAEQYLAAVRKHKPEILAMSALLTTTAFEQRKVIRGLKEAAVRDAVKVVVGGGPVTREFAKEIGADGYEPSAPMAVGLFKKLVGRGA